MRVYALGRNLTSAELCLAEASEAFHAEHGFVRVILSMLLGSTAGTCRPKDSLRGAAQQELGRLSRGLWAALQQDLERRAVLGNGCVADPPQLQASSTVVVLSQVAGRPTALQKTCRYSSSRPLERDYVVEGEVLGCGMSGAVHLAIGRGDGRKYAVKTFAKARAGDLRAASEICSISSRARLFEVEAYLDPYRNISTGHAGC